MVQNLFNEMVNQRKIMMTITALLLLFLVNVQSEASFKEEFVMRKLEKLETENQRLQSIINKQQEELQQFTTKNEVRQNVENLQVLIKDLYQQMEDLNNRVRGTTDKTVHPNDSEVIGFSAYPTEDLEYTPGLTVLFQETEYNSGATYNPEVSVFYCNVPGLYFFSVSILFSLLSSNNYRGEVHLSVEDRIVGIIYAQENSDGFRWQMASKSIITTCSQGGIVYVKTKHDAYVDGGRASTFTGFLLAAA